jgi:hypothetical protein
MLARFTPRARPSHAARHSPGASRQAVDAAGMGIISGTEACHGLPSKVWGMHLFDWPNCETAAQLSLGQPSYHGRDLPKLRRRPRTAVEQLKSGLTKFRQGHIEGDARQHGTTPLVCKTIHSHVRDQRPCRLPDRAIPSAMIGEDHVPWSVFGHSSMGSSDPACVADDLASSGRPADSEARGPDQL